MSETQHKTVFISYRRSVSSFIARAIFLDLRTNGYDVFMDVESIDSGTFDTIILNQIAARAHFLIILTPGTLEDCDKPNDWLRREIEHAMDKQRNIIPILVNEFKFDNVKEFLTGKLEQLPRFNGLPLLHEYFDAGMDRLRVRYFKQPVLGEIEPTPPYEQPAVEAKIKEVTSELPPTKKQLTAEQFLLRALNRSMNNLEGQIADCSEAIRLNPNYADAYNNRGGFRFLAGDIDGAISDFDKAIKLDPSHADAYTNRGHVLKEQGKDQEAIEEYSKAILHDSRHSEAYYSRGLARYERGDYLGAIDDYTHAISISPQRADAYLNRGNSFDEVGDSGAALADYDMAIRLDPQLVVAFSNRGALRGENGDLEGAFADHNEALRLNPSNIQARANRGIAYWQSGNLPRAIEDLQEVIHLAPDLAIPRKTLALIREQQQDWSSALREYEAYLDAGGGWEEGDVIAVELKIKELRAKLQNKK